jgi:hypothetical protein
LEEEMRPAKNAANAKITGIPRRMSKLNIKSFFFELQITFPEAKSADFLPPRRAAAYSGIYLPDLNGTSAESGNI